MERITIEVQDDGSVTITQSEDGEQPAQPMQFKTALEAAGAVRALLVDEGEDSANGEDDQGAETPAPGDEPGKQSMWDQEAKARPAQPGIMR